MNKYVVAFWSDHSGEIHQEEVDAHSKHDAALRYLDINVKEYPDMEAVHNYCANTDSAINVIQIDKKSWKHYTSKGPLHAPVPNFEH